MNKEIGTLLFVNIHDLFYSFAKDHDLNDYFILVSSNDIVASIQERVKISGISTGITYKSKYDNVEFVDTLRPTHSIIEYATRNLDVFAERYRSQLSSGEAFLDICSIMDMVVTSKQDVIITYSVPDEQILWPHIIREFIEDEFRLTGYLYTDIQKLNDYYSTTGNTSKWMVHPPKFYYFDIPMEYNGDFTTILNSGDVEEIKAILDMQKPVAVNMVSNELNGDDDLLSEMFYNKYTETMESRLREVLSTKDQHDLARLAKMYGERANSRNTKEEVIDKIINGIRRKSKKVKYDIG